MQGAPIFRGGTNFAAPPSPYLDYWNTIVAQHANISLAKLGIQLPRFVDALQADLRHLPTEPDVGVPELDELSYLASLLPANDIELHAKVLAAIGGLRRSNGEVQLAMNLAPSWPATLLAATTLDQLSLPSDLPSSTVLSAALRSLETQPKTLTNYDGQVSLLTLLYMVHVRAGHNFAASILSAASRMALTTTAGPASAQLVIDITRAAIAYRIPPPQVPRAFLHALLVSNHLTGVISGTDKANPEVTAEALMLGAKPNQAALLATLQGGLLRRGWVVQLGIADPSATLEALSVERACGVGISLAGLAPALTMWSELATAGKLSGLPAYYALVALAKKIGFSLDRTTVESLNALAQRLVGNTGGTPQGDISLLEGVSLATTLNPTLEGGVLSELEAKREELGRASDESLFGALALYVVCRVLDQAIPAKVDDIVRRLSTRGVIAVVPAGSMPDIISTAEGNMMLGSSLVARERALGRFWTSAGPVLQLGGPSNIDLSSIYYGALLLGAGAPGPVLGA